MDIVKSWQVFWEKFGPGEAWRRVLGEGLTNTLIIAFAGLIIGILLAVIRKQKYSVKNLSEDLSEDKD